MTQPDATTPAGDTRISTLVGDRLCIRCNYNLVGQPILRERHYDMLIVRCPECATVASVQEYPLLGRWANRWGAVLAALWFLLLVALWFGSSTAIFGFAVGSSEVAVGAYTDVLSKQFSAWHTQQTAIQSAAPTAPAAPNTPTAPAAPAAGPPGVTMPGVPGAMIVGPGTTTIIRAAPIDFQAWWQQQDRAALLREAGGIFGGFNWIVCYIWFWLMITSIALGVMWATLLVARGRAGLLQWGLIIILTSAAIGLIPILDWLSGNPIWTRQAASQQVAPAILVLSLLWAFVWLSAGLIFGRSISRGLIRLMLPPRMRSALAFLWLTDGLEPPTSARHMPVRRRHASPT